MCHERGGEEISMRYAMKHKITALQWAGWPVEGGDKISGRGQITLTLAIGHVEEGLILMCSVLFCPHRTPTNFATSVFVTLDMPLLYIKLVATVCTLHDSNRIF